jgi:uncharacterized protein with GYD domain
MTAGRVVEKYNPRALGSFRREDGEIIRSKFEYTVGSFKEIIWAMGEYESVRSCEANQKQRAHK